MHTYILLISSGRVPIVSDFFTSKTLQPPSKSSEVVRKYWAVLEEVDKTLLSEQIQEFCGQFPVIRLEEVDFDSIGKERNFTKSRLGNMKT